MSDIVDRLNEYQVFAKGIARTGLEVLVSDAAAEITRLRADIAKARNEALEEAALVASKRVDLYRDGAGYHLDDSGRTRRNYANVAADADEHNSYVLKWNAASEILRAIRKLKDVDE